jgi:hypothetical protein
VGKLLGGRFRVWVVASAAVVFALVAAGCGDGETIGGQQGSEEGETTFTFGRGPDAVALDPVN